MKKKKEIEIPKPKYIYQRYNGIITKYIVDKEYYISVETGIATKKDETVLLGKISENIIDLLENNDIVMYKIGSIKVTTIGIVNKFNDARSGETVTLINGYKLEEIDILKILTREQFEQGCYTI